MAKSTEHALKSLFVGGSFYGTYVLYLCSQKLSVISVGNFSSHSTEFQKNNVIMFGGKFNRVTLSAQDSGDGKARVTKTLQFSPQPRNKSIYILTEN